MEMRADEMQVIVDVAKRYRRPITIDWTNRTIRVLSPVITHPTKVLSTGPMKYQDILASAGEKP